jgi:hypothetical protein
MQLQGYNRARQRELGENSEIGFTRLLF